MAVAALSMATFALTFRMRGVPLPIPRWWRRVPSFQRRLAYLAIAGELVAASVLLWSIEPGHELPESIRLFRGLGSLVAVTILVWTGVAAARSHDA
ncbi:MAG: hypothetical protein O3A10_16070 [Chloroflexi bacterium]|nr:hypothetical protein [Chloroflexota bacterium]MDA1145327.1 hypothetical protein [Chloroflexota bacterium]